MKVLLLGGAGLEANTVARDLLGHGVEELILADYNEEGARAQSALLAETFGKTVSAEFVDANDEDALVALMKDKAPDIVMNTIGPFFRYGVKIPRAAIQAGCNYVDINDDYEPSVEVLDTLDEAAREKDLTVIIGCGATPGTSNMIGKYCYETLDETDSINIDWLWPGVTGGGAAALQHGFEMVSGSCMQFLDGEFELVPAGTEREAIRSSNGKFDGDVMYVGHGEPATMPRYLRDINEITCKGGMLPREINDFFFHLIGVGLHETEPLRLLDETELDPADIAIALLIRKFKDYNPEDADFGYVLLTAKGRKDGHDKTLQYEFYGSGTEMTAFPASVVAQKIMKGEIKVPGANTPEVLDAAVIGDIFTELRDRGLTLEQIQ